MITEQKKINIVPGNYTPKINTKRTIITSSETFIVSTLPEYKIIPTTQKLIMPNSVCPEDNCKLCKGSGTMYVKNEPYTCDCVEIKKILIHLTPQFLNAGIVENFDLEHFKDRNLLLETTQTIFQAITKTFHIYTMAKIKFFTVTAKDIVDDMFNKEITLEKYYNIPLLIISLGEASANKLYSSHLREIIEKRICGGLYTWIFTDLGLNSSRFKELYSSAFAEYIRQKFQIPGK